jgi:hypothetical protein
MKLTTVQAVAEQVVLELPLEQQAVAVQQSLR